MTLTINDLPVPIRMPSVDFTWSPVGSTFVTTINGNSYPPAGSRFASVGTPSGVPVTFTATVSVDPKAPIVQYKWDTGDGFVKFGSQITHQYRVANPHVEMTLEVTDLLGRTRTVSHALALEVTTRTTISPNVTVDTTAGGLTSVRFPSDTLSPSSSQVPSS
jgi:hypothetical protein